MNYRPSTKTANNTRTLLLGASEVNMRKDPKKDGQLSEQARLMLEESNNKAISDLSEKTSMMLGLALDIESQLKEDKALLDQTGSSFDRVTGLMKGTISNITQMLNTGGSKHMCYLVTFIVCVFLTLYWLMK